MKAKNRIITLLCSVLFATGLVAQNNMNSPYSRFGLGVLSEQQVGADRAMGGIGIGTRGHNNINLLNPASYSTVDTLSFLLDFGFSLQNGNFSENGKKINAKNAGADYVAMQFRVQPKIGMTLAYMPYSKVGYAFSLNEVVRNDEDGEISSTNLYGGAGGLDCVIGGLGWRPTEWLSIGANASYIYGEIAHSVKNSYSLTSIYTRQKTYRAQLSAIKLDYGLQSTIKMGENALVLGVTFAPKTALKGDTYISDVMVNSASEVLMSDTVALKDAFSLPNSFGFGASYMTEKLTVGADVTYQQWSGSKLFGKYDGLDKMRISLGAMYQHDANSKNILKSSIYRAGLYMQQPYCKLEQVTAPTEYGLTAGFSIPVVNRYNNRSTIDISGQYVRMQPANDTFMTENYLRINIGISFSERWFAKWLVE